ncbi:MAG TPA: DUF72 domain-containing protein [Polyangia bacterium]|jgi:uncharacterized protein YecE (DUF72 family)|nr:DUF72 domain-containing protein [Polyangia bacterium]
MRRGHVLIGTSGWIYPRWNAGRFYPADLPAKSRLAFISRAFATVEINGTFYSLSRPNNFAAWRQAVPRDFVFAIKGSRYITHMLKLRHCRKALANFFAQGVLALGRQLGPILWQLPPSLPFDRARADEFLAQLPHELAAAERLARRHDARLNGRSCLRTPKSDDSRAQTLRHAVEVRHASWLAEDALQLLAAHGVALVTADSADHHPLSIERTAGFAYVRLHGSQKLYGSRYDDRELDDWAAQIDAWRARGSDVYVYFDNDEKAYAPADARRLSERLHIGPAPLDASAQRRISSTNEEATSWH